MNLDFSPTGDVTGPGFISRSEAYSLAWEYSPWVQGWNFVRPESRRELFEQVIFVAPIPGATFFGGMARPLNWLRRIRTAEKPAEFATATTWRQYKTASALLAVTGTASIVSYYKEQYLQDVAWRLINGQHPVTIQKWLEDEHGFSAQDSIDIVLMIHGHIEQSRGNEGQAFPASRDIPFSSGGFFSLETWKVPSVQPTRASALPLSPSRRLGRTKSGSTAKRGRRRSSARASRPPYCRVHKRKHWCKFSRRFKK